MNAHLSGLLLNKLLRQIAWRGGRALYMFARGDLSNNPRTNGEYRILARLLDSRQKTSRVHRTVLIDVGANVGDWTINALDVARRLGLSEIEIHAFEPVPSTFDALNLNIVSHSVNGVVRISQLALSAAEGDSKIHVFGELQGTNSIYSYPSKKDYLKIPVKLSTIDLYCSNNNLTEVFFIKCDTEGHDMDVLLGAKNLLLNGKIGFFQFEYNHRWIYSRHFLKDVFDLVVGLPYRVGKILPDRVEFIDRWHPELDRFFEGNYLLAHEGVIPLLPATYGTFDIYNTFTIEV
jgi:FkbM family methyltransferase